MGYLQYKEENLAEIPFPRRNQMIRMSKESDEEMWQVLN